ncbi:MAG: leucine--tRNA ligase, partial [Candidatus Micrarchaeota archaeon]|nr:leucine--tRNA ligase [Candidatus Micrarchaeota archaeon]
REMGFAIDWRRKFYTFDPEFNSFIEWQFHKLRERGYITKGKHPVPFCPKCGNAVGGHDTKGDVDPELGEFVLLKFKFEDGFLLPATLRPETVYGVTNMWINEDADYVKAKINGEICYVSKEAAQKFRLQEFNVEILSEMKGSYFNGKSTTAPIIAKSVPIYMAPFVDPANATGVVMSVPAHAPYDYVALKGVMGEKADGALIPIIKLGGNEFGRFPAKSVVDAMGITSLDDPRLEEATRTVYRNELHHGVMDVEGIRGMAVEEARGRTKQELLNSREGLVLAEIINRPVKCRCGGTVEVKVFDDQWFIDYGNPEWKQLASECLAQMKVFPESRRKDFEYSIGWLHEKACTRATGLGTKFPFDRSKMIEALSDSTLYMAFYTVRHLLRRPLSVEEWDYVILGEGKGTPELEVMRKSFEYWYPLDSRHSGADLIYNHLPFFIFNHAGILPSEKWPKGIVVNGFVLMEGQKMSKSLGNILPLRKAIAEYGPDPIRISVVGGAELSEDTDFNRKMVEGVASRLRFIAEIAGTAGDSANRDVERWLEGRADAYFKEAYTNYSQLNLREVVNTLLYKFVNDTKWCLKRGGRPARRMLKRWAVLMSPLCPHFCDELWERLGEKGFASAQVIQPSMFGREESTQRLDEIERIIQQTVEDIAEIRKLLNREPRQVTLIVAGDFKRKVFSLVGDSKNANDAIRNVMSDEEMRAHGKEAMAVIKSAMKWKSGVVLSEEEELSALIAASQFISGECGAPVKVISEKDAAGELAQKAAKALPGKPSIFFE